MWQENDGTAAIRRMPHLTRVVITVSRCMTDDLQGQKDVVTKWANVNPSLQEISITRTQRWVKCGPGDWQLAKGYFRTGRT